MYVREGLTFKDLLFPGIFRAKQGYQVGTAPILAKKG
jgi:hypothetical protein